MRWPPGKLLPLNLCVLLAKRKTINHEQFALP